MHTTMNKNDFIQIFEEKKININKTIYSKAEILIYQ